MVIINVACCFMCRESNSNYSSRSQAQSVADKTEYIQQISGLLGSKDFRDRIKGIDQLVADCQHNPNMVINSIFPVSLKHFSISVCTVARFLITIMHLCHHQGFTLCFFLPFRCLMPSGPDCKSLTARSTCTPWSPYRKSSTC